MRIASLRWIPAVVLAGGVWIAPFAGAQKASRPEVALEAAAKKELVEGDLKGAIDLYQRMVTQYSRSDRAAVAKALLRMGQCYEKLGSAEARKAYERVLKEYGDQKDALNEARARLAAIGAAAPGTLTTRQVWAGREVDVGGSVSPDGRYFSYADLDTGNVAIRDLLTGEKRLLTSKGAWDKPGGYAILSRISPDGKQIAYDWWSDPGAEGLHVGNLDGTGHRLVYRVGDLGYPNTCGWSPDGRHVLALLSKGGRSESHMATVGVADGSVRVLKTTAWARRAPWNPSFSPDGKFVLFDSSPAEGAEQRDLYLVSADGRREVHLVEHPADDQALGWSPDGRTVLFTSDRTGEWDLWSVAVSDGKAQGAPVLVKRGIGRVTPLGITRDGALYYGLTTGLLDVYVASLDVAAGKVEAPPVRATEKFVGANGQGDWSPDGRRLVFVSFRERHPLMGARRVLCIVSPGSAGQRELSLDLESFFWPRWSPDGKSILVRGSRQGGRLSLYLVDAATGSLSLVAGGDDGRINRFAVAWSRNGKTIFYGRFSGTPPNKPRVIRIMARNLETGAEQELYREEEAFYGGDSLVHDLAMSPDGKYLAFVECKRDPKVIKVIPTAGGRAREVMSAPKDQLERWRNFSGLVWTADSREILYVRGDAVWAVSVERGTSRPLGLTMKDLREVSSLAPDGKRLAFTTFTPTREVWVMENLLPQEAASR